MTKPHLSPSQLAMLSRCGEAYRRRYIEGEVIPPGIAAIKGRGVHRGAETNFRQKIESHIDLPQSDIVDAAVAGFEADVQGGYVLTSDEESRGVKAVLAEAKDDVASMAEVYAAEQAPDYQPVLVEKVVTIELPSISHDMMGIIDLADDKDRLVDFKTSGKAKPQSEADGSVQLLTYAAAFNVETGRMPTECRLDTLVTTKTKTYRSVVSTTFQEEHFDILAARINTALKVIQAGVFMPAPADSWQCAEKWCGFAMTCPYYRKDRK